MQLTRHPEAGGSRAVYSVEAPSLAALGERLRIPAEHLILFLAADTREADPHALVEAAEALVRAGAAYACCWGPGSGRLESCFDEADFTVRGENADSVVMTTSHADESLEEALWFAVNAAFPAGEWSKSLGVVVAAAIGAPAWGAQIRRYLDSGAPMLDEA